VRVEAAGETAWFVAHLVARRGWWLGEIVAAMNAQFRQSADVAPRSHPNDGRVDVLRVASAMSVRHRLAARSRLAQGTHVPHPDIETRQVRSAVLSFRRPLHLWLDGTLWRKGVRDVTLTVEPDALQIVF
jgi:diacylglycerol kinase family enzyme